jgi:hypothetical protein
VDFAVSRPALLAAGALAASVVLGACSSGSGSHSASATSAPATTAAVGAAPPASVTSVPVTSVPVGSVPVAATGASKCPTLAQAEAALGGSYGGPVQTPVRSIGVVCEYTGSSAATNAGVTVFAHLTAPVFAGQVSNAGRAPGMHSISGVGDGAFGLSAGGRTVVNAWQNASRTVVAAQSAGSLAQTEALARVGLADN